MTAPLAAILLGPTASGKTALAVALAERLPIEVVSADSRQVYRHLDVGTAKPTAAERAAVPHHLIDILELEETYNAARFAADALRHIEAIRSRGHVPLVVGGAGFYLEVLEKGLFEPPYGAAELAAVRAELEAWSRDDLQRELERRDPARAAAIHPNDRYRLARALEICIASGRSVTELTAARQLPDRRFAKFRVVVERGELHARIESRARAMLDGGWIEEVRAALAAGAQPDCPGLAALGYPHVSKYLQGELSRQSLHDLVARDTRRFARAQETWFRKARDATPVGAADPSAAQTLATELEAAFGT